MPVQIDLGGKQKGTVDLEETQTQTTDEQLNRELASTETTTGSSASTGQTAEEQAQTALEEATRSSTSEEALRTDQRTAEDLAAQTDEETRRQQQHFDRLIRSASSRGNTRTFRNVDERVSSTFGDTVLSEIFGPDIRDRIPGLFANIGQERGQLNDLIRILTERGTRGVESSRGFIRPIVEGARVEGERRLGQDLQALQRAAGTTGVDSLVTALAGEQRSDFLTQLAALEGQLLLGAQERESGDLGTLQALLQRPSSISEIGLLSTLRGSGASEHRTGASETGRTLRERGGTTTTSATRETSDRAGTVLDDLFGRTSQASTRVGSQTGETVGRRTQQEQSQRINELTTELIRAFEGTTDSTQTGERLSSERATRIAEILLDLTRVGRTTNRESPRIQFGFG